MAGLHHYKCINCDFELYSTPWGGDIWMSGYGYYLYCCEGCKKLTKIEHGFTSRAQKEIEERSIFITPKGDTLNITSRVCSHCGSTLLSRWKPEDGICPKCNATLIGSDEPLVVKLNHA